MARLTSVVPHRMLRARALALLQLLAAPPVGSEAKVVRELTLVLQSAGGIADATAPHLMLREDVLLALGAIFDNGTTIGQESFRVHGYI